MNSKAVRIMLAAILAFSMVMINICMVNADAAADWYDQKNVSYNVVVSAGDGYVNVRSGPGTEYDILGTIHNGAEVRVIAEAAASNGNIWGQIPYEGAYCWIALSQVKKVNAEPVKPAPEEPEDSLIKTLYTGGQSVSMDVVVSAPDGGVNLRYGPGTEYEIRVSMIKNNTVLHVTKEAYASNGKKWGCVSVGGVTGWIFLPQTTELIQEPYDNNQSDETQDDESNEVQPAPTDSAADDQSVGEPLNGVPMVVVVLIVLIVILIAVLAIILILKKKNDGSFNE